MIGILHIDHNSNFILFPQLTKQHISITNLKKISFACLYLMMYNNFINTYQFMGAFMIFYDYILPLIITILLIVFYVVFFTIKYKNSTDDEKMKPIKWLYYALIITEVLKIFYLIMENKEFRPLRYPLVFCSTIMYTVPLFLYKTRLSNIGKVTTIYSSIIAFTLFAAIQWMYKMSLIQCHSYFYHGAMMAIAVYLIASKLYKFNKKEFYDMFIFLYSKLLLIFGLHMS